MVVDALTAVAYKSDQMSNEKPFEAFAAKLESLVKELDDKMPDAISAQIMVELEAQHKQRIFGEGLNSEGEKIGEYSKKSGYYSKDLFIRKSAFKPGVKAYLSISTEIKINKKTGKVTAGKEVRHVNKDKMKTMYLQGGYSEFRDIQGRQTEFVNIKFSGSAERGIGIVKVGDAVLYGTRDLKESKKLLGNVERFGDFLSLSKEEQLFINTEIADVASQIANGKS